MLFLENNEYEVHKLVLVGFYLIHPVKLHLGSAYSNYSLSCYVALLASHGS